MADKKKNLHFTVVESKADPVNIKIGHSPLEELDISQMEKDGFTEKEFVEATKIAEHGSLAYVNPYEKKPVIHIMPNFMYDRYSPEYILAHESLHIVLGSLGERQASSDYDKYRLYRDKKDIWEFD